MSRQTTTAAHQSDPAFSAQGSAANDQRAGSDLYVARQPIFDPNQRVTGYELLFRNSTDNRYDFNDGSQASRLTVNTSVNVVGLMSVVGDVNAWVNLPRELIVNEFHHVLPSDRIVVELLEDIEPDDDVIAACRRMKQHGYTLALDDFVFDRHARYAPLIELADAVKIDLLQTTVEESAPMIAQYARPGLTFLAEKVEDHDQFEAAKQAGFGLFQGFFFCKPEVLHEQDLSASKQNYLLFLAEVAKPELDYEAVEKRVKLEPSLSVKLLRYINSAGLGLRHRVPSIKQALALLGEKTLRQWGALVAATCLAEDKPTELLRTCLYRARFCEVVGAQLDDEAGEVDHFLLGLLSVLDAVLDRPLEKILPTLPVSTRIRSALLGDNSSLALLCFLSVACERGDWRQVKMLSQMLGIDHDQPAKAHHTALQWADSTLTAGFNAQADG